MYVHTFGMYVDMYDLYAYTECQIRVKEPRSDPSLQKKIPAGTMASEKYIIIPGHESVFCWFLAVALM
jgi:hypothetical protein